MPSTAMARSHQNRGQDAPAPDPGYRRFGGRLYYFDGHGLVWVQDDTGTQAAGPAEQARQPPPQDLGNVGPAYSTTFDGAIESNTHSSAAMDPRAYASGESQDPRVQVQNSAPSMQDSAFQIRQPASPSSTMTNFGSCPSTAGSYLPGTDTSPVQVSSHARGIDDSNANYSWGMDQFVANQTVHAGARNNAPSLSFEVVDTMGLYYKSFPKDADQGGRGRNLSDSDENERSPKRQKASKTKSKDGTKKKPRDDGTDKKTKDDRKDRKKPKDDSRDKKKKGGPTE
ncbi:hypothetical protein BKA56DRAFT_49861 [Ilyonectria sp. MPI-CAGE-AT-0026]|nr:hypothetical protein BKA56DRAFT_49861 [Ilyonectria sp. MPI-CAGE-AT-0026]